MAPRALFSIRALNHVSGPAVTSPRPPTRTAHCPRAALVFLFSHALLVGPELSLLQLERLTSLCIHYLPSHQDACECQTLHFGSRS